MDLYLQAVYETERSPYYFIELKYVKARTAKHALESKVRDGREAMQWYLESPVVKEIPNVRGYVLVFRKDRCVRKIQCS